MPNLLQDSSILLLMHAANLGMGALLCPAIPVAEGSVQIDDVRSGVR